MKFIAVNRRSQTWWTVDSNDIGIGPTYVWNSDPQLDLEPATMRMEIDRCTGPEVVGNTCYYAPKGIC